MKFAIIGSGGREHALAWKMAKSLGQDNVYTLPGNAGIPNSHSVDTSNFEAVATFCKENEIAYIFVGPEQPLADGIVNFFEGSGIGVVGPDKAAAQLEASKIFSKRFMAKYGVSTADFEVFERAGDATATIERMNGDLVIKYDGLAAGKGVYVCDNIAEATAAIAELTAAYGEEFPFIIEEKIPGDEVSIIAFTDGKTVKCLQPSQDHKQRFEGDKGPNTGGMGTYCPVPGWTDTMANKVEEMIINPTIKGIQGEGMKYTGMIYFGIMVKDNTPYLLEYNVRFGDPETEVLLPSLKTDLESICLACLNGTLADIDLEFEPGYFVDVVLVSDGYPKAYPKGKVISGLDKVAPDTIVFHAGTKMDNNQVVTNGGRVLNVVCQGETLEAAIERAYTQVPLITFEGVGYRKDIGQRENNELG